MIGCEDPKQCHWRIWIRLLSQFNSGLLFVKLSVVQSISRWYRACIKVLTTISGFCSKLLTQHTKASRW